MTDLPLYDFPLVPKQAIIVAPQNVGSPMIARSHFENMPVVPGARNQMRLSFTPIPERDGKYVSWLSSMLSAALFRIPVFKTPQLATSDDIKAAEEANRNGINFSTGQPFSTGFGFKFHPTLDLAADAAEGTNSITIDTTRWPGALDYGKCFGLGLSVYMVEDISVSGTTATVKCRPPLRRDYEAGELVQLRPKMIGKAKDPSSFASRFQIAGISKPGEIVFNEFIDGRFL